MLTFIHQRKNKYLLLLPVFFLVLNAIYFQYAAKEIQAALIKEKYIEIVNAVNTLAAAVEANPNRQWLDHEDNIRDSVEFIDKLDQVYAGVYKYNGENFFIISERYYETSPLEPLDNIMFRKTVLSSEYGDFTIGYTPEHQSYREMHLYFKWMPTYSPANERFLVVAGVSRYSVISSVSMWVSVGQWASMTVTFALNTWLILLLTRLGDIYEKRVGDKWRKEVGE